MALRLFRYPHSHDRNFFRIVFLFQEKKLFMINDLIEPSRQRRAYSCDFSDFTSVIEEISNRPRPLRHQHDLAETGASADLVFYHRASARPLTNAYSVLPYSRVGPQWP